MTRSRTLSTSRHPFAAWALLPLVLAACGGDAPAARTSVVTAGATAPAESPKSVATAEVPADEALQPARSAAVRYADAESVYRARNYAEAVRQFEEYVGAHPDDAHGHYMLGLSAWKAGDPARAELALDRSLELDPDNVKGWLNSARVLLDADRPREALERVRAALDREGDSVSTDALRLLARTRARLGETDSAIATYRRVLVLSDHDVWAMNNLGLLHLEQGDARTALPPLARAVQLRPTAPVFQNNLGIALERTGSLAAAQRAFEAALRADGGYTKAATSLARVLPLVDSTAAAQDTTTLDELAEEFRMQVRMWRDGVEGEEEHDGC